MNPRHFQLAHWSNVRPGFPWTLWRALVDLGMDPEHAFEVVGPTHP